MNNYVLENEKEFDRLEKQSKNKAYDFEEELRTFFPKETGNILDAGCGSGVVTRFLANKYPSAKVFGCDFSAQRVKQANQFVQAEEDCKLPNLEFSVQDLTKLEFKQSTFDAIHCRFVLEHMSNDNALKALKEFHRCMSPNGRLCVTDIDGLVFNLFPLTKMIEDAFLELKKIETLDLFIGRKLPKLISEAGFSNISYRIDTLQFRGNELEDEIQLIRERFAQAMPAIKLALGSEDRAKQFVSEYFECLEAPGAVLFYNKFIITAGKQTLKLQK